MIPRRGETGPYPTALEPLAAEITAVDVRLHSGTAMCILTVGPKVDNGSSG